MLSENLFLTVENGTRPITESEIQSYSKWIHELSQPSVTIGEIPAYQPIPFEGTSKVSDDPILKMIGLADVEPFGHKIDEKLYGAGS